MFKAKNWLSLTSYSLLVSVLSAVATTTSALSISLTNSLTIDGNSTDLYPFAGNSANVNRLGGFFSDLYYDRTNDIYYGIPDRGPGGGLISYETRVQKFALDVDLDTGAISNFKLLDTIPLTNNGGKYNGLNPTLLNGNTRELGLSLDPEGFAVGTNGNFYISDEYGPSVYEFNASGSFVRAFATPNNILPLASGTPNYVDGRPTITSGRQDNRGFEGLTLSPDGRKLYTVLQAPLVNEGSPDGRSSQNLRIVEYDTVTGQNLAQYAYTLESLEDINARIPGDEEDFDSDDQGRSIGLSAITALNDSEFLVIERDNRGIGEADPTGEEPVSSKRVYKIDLSKATDISNISLSGTNTLPDDVNTVSKSLFLDIADSLQASGQAIPEKFEGLAIGPQLTDGSYAVLIGTDNDFSVTQTGEGVQTDVCTDGTTVAIDAGCPEGSNLIPTYLYSFKANSSELKGFVTSKPVPEPSTTVGVVLLGLSSFWLKRRQAN